MDRRVINLDMKGGETGGDLLLASVLVMDAVAFAVKQAR